MRVSYLRQFLFQLGDLKKTYSYWVLQREALLQQQLFKSMLEGLKVQNQEELEEKNFSVCHS